MTFRTLLLRSLTFFWRTNLAVVAGVAVAVSVLAGALLVGDSVRGSLRTIALERLGRADVVATGQAFVRQRLADDLMAQPEFRRAFDGATALIALEGTVTHGPAGRRAGRVQVYGIDDRFFAFHGRSGVKAPASREALLSESLAAELAPLQGEPLQIRVQKPSAIPGDTLTGQRDDTSRAVRVSFAGTLSRSDLGEFSLRAQQEAVRAIFVPIARLQRDLELPDGANVVLMAARPDAAGGMSSAAQGPALEEIAGRSLSEAAQLEDLGVKLVPVEAQHAWSLESETGLVSEALEASSSRSMMGPGRLGFASVGVLTYLANSIRVGTRTVPYSVVAGLNLDRYAQLPRQEQPIAEYRMPSPAAPPAERPPTPHPPIWLSAWAAEDLQAKRGDTVTLEYFLWSDENGLGTSSATFTLVDILPMEGAAVDSSLTPSYPGITDARRIGDWDPPFPVDLTRIGPRDEEFWDRYRAAPKAFVTLATAQQLWASRYGRLTSIRFYVPGSIPLESARGAFARALREFYGPRAAGLSVQAVKTRALQAAQGSTDFGEYFVYFSFFLVVAGLLLTALFFKLGLEQRVGQVGLFEALGYTMRRIRGLLLAEGVLIAIVGSLIGMLGAVGFSSLILYGLRTWWSGAVGTDRLTLHVTPESLLLGGVGGVAIAVLALAGTLRSLAAAAPRALLTGLAVAGTASADRPGRRWRLVLLAALLLALALLLIGASAWSLLPATAGFFGAGAALLGASLCAFSLWLRRRPANEIAGTGFGPIARLGARQTSYRPGRSVLSAALIAMATFLIVAVGAFRRDAPVDSRERSSGTGGFPLFAESVVPLLHDPGSPAGRAELDLDADPSLADVDIARFRLKPGDDGSCLNLFRPANPRLLAPTPGFVREGRFRFARSMAASDAERQNPWLLLDRQFDDGAVPVIGDANSLTYSLHVGVGDDLLLPGPDGQPILTRVVAALSDSIFQSELLIAERHFVRLFPRSEGYRFFLVGAARSREQAVASALEERLGDFGLDVQETAGRLATYHRVENAYLSTFQTLGGLGLVLGTFGLGTILLRNVLERRRELGLLRAVGYRQRQLSTLIVAECSLLLLVGLGAGAASALLAIAPAFLSRGSAFPVMSTGLLLAAVFLSGLLSAVAATRVAATAGILASLRSE
jgi:putative ABC transport system permease protein